MSLPSLPFELQFAIMRHVPPNQIFVLRRVSHSWNIMLDNPHLLAAINNSLPFLTSACDLTSRMKRRMRMVRGDPVWVKPFADAFPWASRMRENTQKQWERFCGGWLVFLSRETLPKSPNSAGDYTINLTIGRLLACHANEVDMLALVKRVYPAFSRLSDIEYGRGDHPGSWVEMPVVKRFHLHVQEGMVIVGLRLEQQIRDGRVTTVESCNYGA